MDEYLNIFDQYKDIKEIADLIDEVKKLRIYYNTQQYEAMNQLITSLTGKYLSETMAWNVSHPVLPSSVHEAYINAQNFLKQEGNLLLVKYRII